ncbi:MAG: NAD-dependent epimerase/dehydratase family protein, partial [Planctomycetota bacterium]|nr:NAD-dependent epimerase/dehydratase family protein [Planctomycetota bacterium]
MSLVLVTGGAGFIGSHLVERLVSKGHTVRVIDDFSSGKLENLEGLDCGDLGSGKQVEIIESCITDPVRVPTSMQGVDWVVHLAAQVSVPRSIEDPRMSYRINVDGTQNILDSARLAGAKRVVFAASSAAYGDHTELPLSEDLMPRPLSPYASGKLAGEHLMRVWAECYGMHTTSLRFFNVFGPRQADDSPYTGVIAIFAKALIEGSQPTIYGDGSQTRDFTFV